MCFTSRPVWQKSSSQNLHWSCCHMASEKFLELTRVLGPSTKLRFHCALAERFTNDQIDLKQEPTLESFGVRLPKEQQNGSTDHQQHEQQQQQGRADTDEADFWRPSKEEDSSSGANGAASESGSDAGLTDEGEGSDREVDAMDGVEAAAAAAEAGSSAEPMDEDKPRGRRKSAINTGHQAVGQANGSIKSKKQPCNGAAEFHNKQQQAGARIGVSKTEKKKQNINRPSAAKKVKR
eukprot:GHRR01014271.1.p1 GENE.GHRR01014271.1~~GHRR01014271.1.p1  ORF type:complete len:236 (+),score=83.87 GHRR01014271.1:977-1684(+)